MRKMTLSKHAREERMDRLMLIAQKIGWGEDLIVLDRKTHWEILTDTGVILITDHEKRDFLVTAYIASIDRAVALYHDFYGNDNFIVPAFLTSKIEHNRKIRQRAGGI